MRIHEAPFVLGLLLLLAGTGRVGAQPQADSGFQAPSVWPAQVGARVATDLRTGSGHPGPSDWQNHAQYRINARLDTSARTLSGTVAIEYTNNSPSPLSSVWLLVGSTGEEDTTKAPAPSNISIQTVEVSRDTTEYDPKTVGVEGRRQVRLREPVSAGGGTVTLTVSYTVALTPDGQPGWMVLPSGDLYSMGQWCPRVAAYTPDHGWAAVPRSPSQPPLGEYGSFDYSLTVPASFIVAGSGTLMNPNDVLTADQRRRLMRARDSRQKVAIITPDQAGSPDTRPKLSGTLTWRFQMNGVRNVAWAASPSFIWNGATFTRPGKRDGLAMAYYPPSAMGGQAWNRATYHTQKAVSLFSRTLYAYPWNNAITVTGPDGGAAFPGLSVCASSATGAALFGCAIQNQSYNWFPGIVGVNLSRHPWLAHGLRAYISTWAHQRLYDGEFAGQKSDPLPSPATMAERLGAASAPLLAPSRLAPTSFTTREKPGFGLQLLRDYVLDAERVHYALRQFTQRWAFRVPRPQDFFRAVSDATGDDLSWFWTGWYAATWQVDLAVTGVSYPGTTPAEGAKIKMSLHRPMPMPVRATVVESDGDTHRLHLPVEIWRDGSPHVTVIDSDSRLQRIILDPERHLPDINRSNNTWTAPES